MLTTTRDQPKVGTVPRERLPQPRVARRSAASRSINSPASEQKPVTRNRLRRRIRVVRDRFRIENSQRKGQPGGHHWDVPFRIIRAKPADWEVYRSIRLRSLREEPDAYASGLETEARYEPELWQQRLATAFTYLAFDDDHDLVGIATGLWTQDGDTHVVGMYVVPQARGRRCAHQLLDAIADLAIRRQGRRLVLEVAQSNVRATRCYHAYGFVETGRRRLMDRDPSITEIELEYPLPG
jgi:ribosomal protein S18 acetylase RimI-like enzyme